MATASLLFALMGVAVKLASTRYGAGELVMYRSLVGLVLIGVVMRLRRIPMRTPVPGMHMGRSVSGTVSLAMWFYAIGGLPLATATTLNYMSSVWIALFLMGGALLLGPRAGRGLDGRLIATVLAGFAGVTLVLRPTIADDQLWHGLIGLLSGILSAVAYLQITALGRVGEPGERVVFYFSLAGVVVGLAITLASGSLTPHTSWRGVALLLAIGTLATAAQWMITRAYATGATLGVATLQYLGIGFAFVFGVWLFNDPVTPLALVGMLLIVGAGVAATFLRQRSTPADAGPTES